MLSRKMLERIYVGDDIIITVTDIDRGKVKLAIHAPNGVKVFREELLTDDEKRQIEFRATDGRGM